MPFGAMGDTAQPPTLPLYLVPANLALVDKDAPSHQAQAASACFTSAGIGAEARVKAREEVVIQEVRTRCFERGRAA